MNVHEMKCLRNMVGVLRMDRVRTEEVRRRALIEKGVGGRGGSESVEMDLARSEHLGFHRHPSRVLMSDESGA